VIQKVILIRHAKPLISRKGFFDYQKAQEFIVDYDEAGVEEIKEKIHVFDEEISLVYCSTLNRAKATASAIFGSKVVLVEMEMFREFERRIPQIPLLFLPIGLWLLIARVSWLLGITKGVESFKQAQKRLQTAVAFIEQKTRENGSFILVAHGLLNRSLIKKMAKKGWKRSSGNHFNYLSIHILEKTVVDFPQNLPLSK